MGLVFVGACSEPAPNPCELLSVELPALDAPDGAARWRAIADALSGEPAVSAAALAVVAAQVAALGAEASLEDRAAVALRPAVADHLAVVAAHRDRSCAG